MDNITKLDNLLRAIDEVETFPDGSVRIKWASNVYHEYPGHVINVADGSVVMKGHHVHLNPELSESIKTIEFQNVQTKLDEAVKESNQEIPDRGCC